MIDFFGGVLFLIVVVVRFEWGVRSRFLSSHLLVYRVEAEMGIGKI